jgi:AAA15 family ATPase/GTPase
VLLRIRVANVRSLRDEQELTFVVPDAEISAAARRVVLGGEQASRVLPLIGIFGANASGKSNVLAALVEMRTAVVESYAKRASYDGIPRSYFALEEKWKDEPSFFEVDIEIDGIRWTYGFELGPRRVEAEWLHSYPRGYRQVWLDRDASRINEFE